MIGIESLYFAAGAIGGLLIGLVGAGIGPIVVPVMILCLPLEGITGVAAIQVAICTSLAVILFTNLFAVMAHNRNGSINWPHFYSLLPGSLVGSIIGVSAVLSLRENILKSFFSIFLFLLGIYTLVRKKPRSQKDWPKPFIIFSISGIIAFFSNLLGVSDGLFMVPFLRQYQTNILKSIGTSTALSIPISTIGLIALLTKSIHAPLLHPLSIGYIYIPAFIAILLGSALFSRIGIHMGKLAPEYLLRNLFAVMMLTSSVILFIK